MTDLEVPFEPSRWQGGVTTYDDGSTRASGRWADVCQAPSCDQLAPAVRGPGLGWMSIAVREPNVWLVMVDPVHGERRSLVHDQVFWFCSPAHIAAWTATLREATTPPGLDTDPATAAREASAAYLRTAATM